MGLIITALVGGAGGLIAALGVKGMDGNWDGLIKLFLWLCGAVIVGVVVLVAALAFGAGKLMG